MTGKFTKLKNHLESLTGIYLLDVIIIGRTENDEECLQHFLLEDEKSIVSTIDGKQSFESGNVTFYKGENCCNKNAVCISLKNPSWDDLKECLSVFLSEIGCPDKILNQQRIRSVFYCGHGLLDGSVLLQDKAISFFDFGNVVFPNNWRNDDHTLNLYLNCCFALRIAELMFPEQKLGGMFETALFDDFEQLESSSQDESQDLQDAVNLLNRTLRRKLPTIVSRPTIKCVPLGCGPMYGVGNIKIVLDGLTYRKSKGNISSSELPDALIVRYRDWSLNDVSKHAGLYRKDEQPKAAVDAPQLQTFPARRGDSFLLRVGGWNLLVDGGFDSEPCFWPTVRCLKDYHMLLTHSDQDHINGLVFAVKAEVLRKEKNELKLPELRKFYVAHSNTVKTKMRTWDYATSLASNLEEEYLSYPNEACSVVFEDDKFMVRLIRVLPSEAKFKHRKKSLAQYLREHLKKADGCKWANETGLVFVIQIENSSTKDVNRLLFTGDAFGKDIAKGLIARKGILKEAFDEKDGRFTMDVMNVPHHGSDKNQFSDLLQACRAKRYIVSTNGEVSSFKHPGDGVLKALSEEIKNGARVHFSYKEFADKLKSLLKNDKFNRYVTFGEKPFVFE